MISGTAALAELVRPASGTDESGAHRMLPVAAELGNLLPGGGLRRGSTVAVAGGRAARAGGGTSLMLALLAAASRAGSWCAVVGLPALGALAAAETGIVLERLALVPEPGPDWPTVVAALIDGVDVVVTAVPGPVSASIASRLAARARQRGSVLMPFGDWSGADVTLQVSRGRWEGLGDGRGRLRRREVTVVANGRGAAARPRELTLWMPGLTTRPDATPAIGGGTPATSPDTRPMPVVPEPSGDRAIRAVPAPADDVSPVRPASARAGDVSPARPASARAGDVSPVSASARAGGSGNRWGEGELVLVGAGTGADGTAGRSAGPGRRRGGEGKRRGVPAGSSGGS
ncbi:hypothetical protein GCM10010168_79490 [Actinoplanes ianthinogenes]|uniref:YjeF N-terminal domain-containing protein n=1 Tax=Actinoplanes ianthinogenes TaxID=122358 RepID=A0ABN6CKA8_9ACTN|nr:hypothetical protein Aiant_60700 [Actinoplanes ianthinogenes]GGR48872.1 hypothetical protein GCM10010168_79490 [Actinoplanes ianthinogenes]